MKTPEGRLLRSVTVGLTLVLAGIPMGGKAALASGPPLRAAVLPPAPALAEGGVWINGKETTLAAQRGKVVLLTFWTFGCINCKRALPFWNAWAKRFRSASRPGVAGVTMLSVHTPEMPSERPVESVRRAVEEHRLAFPVVTDNEFKNWKAFAVRVWPTTILIDQQGRIRGRWEGELDWKGSGAYKMLERQIETVRREKQPQP